MKNLYESILNKVQLNESILNKVQLNKSILNKVQLNESILNKVQLNESILNKVQLNKSILNKVQLNKSILNKVQLNKSILSGAQLTKSILNESIFTTNTKTISDEISKKYGYEDKGDYEQAYMYNYNGITNGYIIWPKSNKATIHITSKMFTSLQIRLKYGIILYICPIGGKKLYDKGDITLHFDSELSDDQGDLYIVWGGSKRGMLTIDGADFLLNGLNISSNDNIKLYPQISSIFDFIALPDDKDKAAISSPNSPLHKVLDNKYNITLSSNITAYEINAQGERSTTITIYGDLTVPDFEYGSTTPDLDFGRAKIIDKSNNAIFGLQESLDDVKSKWHPKDGLFTEKDPQAIASYLLSHSKTPGQAMQRLVFYMNRAGEDCPNKTVLNKAKKIIHSKEQ